MRTQIILLLALLAVLELAARVTSPYRGVPSASEAVSNPLGRRGWPEYLRPTETDNPVVILISNSQAQGLDIANPARRYVALMRAQLEAAHTPIQIENWSSEGILTGELEILTVKAMRRRPVLVVYVLGISNFDTAREVSLARAGSDIGILAGNPLLWPALSQTLVWRNSNAHDFLYRTLLATSGFARERIVMEDDLALKLSKPTQKSLFGRFLDLRPAPNTRPPIGNRAAMLAEAAAMPEHTAKEETTVADLAGLIGRERTTKVLWVWMPAALGVTSARLYREARDLYAHSEPALRDAGADVHDLTTAFNDNEFLTQFHLNVTGHQHMAQVLLPLVLRALR